MAIKNCILAPLTARSDHVLNRLRRAVASLPTVMTPKRQEGHPLTANLVDGHRACDMPSFVGGHKLHVQQCDDTAPSRLACELDRTRPQDSVLELGGVDFANRDGHNCCGSVKPETLTTQQPSTPVIQALDGNTSSVTYLDLNAHGPENWWGEPRKCSLRLRPNRNLAEAWWSSRNSAEQALGGIAVGHIPVLEPVDLPAAFEHLRSAL